MGPRFLLLPVLLLLFLVLACRRGRRRRRRGSTINPEPYRILSSARAAPRRRVAIACMLRRPVVDWPVWFQHHRRMGVGHFYVWLEDTPGVGDILRGWPDVTCVEAGHDDDDGGVDAAAWGTNVHERMARRQDEWVRRALALALARGTADWLVHIDGDELLHGTLAALDALGDGVVCARLHNAEAVYDDPSAQNKNGCYAAVRFRRCGVPGGAPCRAYENGKSAARVRPGVRPWGPHQFAYHGKAEGAHVAWVPFDRLCVLHFDVCTFGVWAEKFWHLAQQHGSGEDIGFDYYRRSLAAVREAHRAYSHGGTTAVAPTETIETIEGS